MLFGTDGIRGIADKMLKNGLPRAVGKAVASLKKGAKVVIATDTRLSAFDFETQIIEGLSFGGAIVLRAGILPTPALAYITACYGADYGIMISASHNPPEYNGIKIFGADGGKISLNEEKTIEEILLKSMYLRDSGEVISLESAEEQYIDYIVKSVGSLKGLTVTLDCCHGATASAAPKVFKKLGANVVVLCKNMSGELVNVYSGATHIEYLKGNMKSDLGFAFDGDGDRVIGVYRNKIMDGDAFLYCLARDIMAKGELFGNLVVGTKLTNGGLIKSLNEIGIDVITAEVGDKYVLESMKATGAVLGGEPAGHIILKKAISTGDGILGAALMSKLYLNSGADFLAGYNPYPRFSASVCASREILKRSQITEGIAVVEKELGKRGRILVRPSGTEPVIRLMAEGEEEAARTAIQALKALFI